MISKEKKKFTFLSKFLYLLTRRQKVQIIYLATLLIIGMLLEIGGLMILIPVINLMQKTDFIKNYPELIPYLTKIGYPNTTKVLVFGLFVMSFYFLIKSAFSIFVSWKQSNFSVYMTAELGDKIFAGYLNQPYLFHLRTNSSKLTSIIQNEVVQFSNALQALISLSVESSMIVSISFTLFYIQPQGAVLLILFLGFSILFFHFLTKNKISQWGKMRQYNSAKLNQHLIQGFGGVKEIKLLARQKYFLNQFNLHNYTNAKTLTKVMFLGLIPRSYLELLMVFGLSGLIVILAYENINFETSISIIGIFVAAAFRILPSINRVMTSFQTVRFIKPVVGQLYEELKGLEKNENLIIQNNSQTISFNKEIVCRNLVFSYEDKPSINLALNNVNLIINKGESVGIVGQSGSGKTTLINLILGLLEPTTGEVLVDEKSIYKGIINWQKNIGYVPQTIYLIDDTLINNIAFGIEENKIDREAVWSAIKSAQLETFVNQLEKGLDTFVGERGARLSGGQIQRIAIARALYHKPEVLILDEATSALDTKTESDVMEAISNLHGKKTIIIVTHRITTIKNCDRIYKLELGKIAFQGKYEDVSKSNLHE
jgi:ABC-type multidrug transport system fused ATPase/permease subunit